MISRLCKIYKSPRKKLTFLYVDFTSDLQLVPAELLETFGEPELVMSLKLEPQRRLALLEGATVLAQIEKCGFYLQMPPPGDHPVAEWMRSGKAN